MTRVLHRTDSGLFFVSFNTVLAPSPPPPRRNFDVFYPEETYTRPTWFYDRFPFLGFTSRSHPWHGPIFGRLHGSILEFPVHSIQGEHWHLDPVLQQSWYRLERALILVYEALIATRPEFLHPLHFRPFRLPSQWGFMRVHESEKAARIRICNARNAFVPLLALCMYGVSITKGRNIQLQEKRSNLTWIRSLVEDQNVDAEWVNELARSDFLSEWTLRVGVYIDWSSFTYPHLLPLFIDSGVPIWIKISTNAISSLPSILRPSLDEFRKFEARCVDISVSALPSQQQQQEGNVPPSGQLNGETFLAFMKRMNARNQRLALTETDNARLKRHDRERIAASYACPGRGGAFVFEWVNVDGKPARLYVPRWRVPDVWNSFAKTQKWYNGFRNEWDLCVDLDPTATIDDEEEEEEHYDWEIQDVPLEGPLELVGLPEMSRTDLQDAYTEVQPRTTLLEHRPLPDILFLRYGFHFDGHSYALPSTMSTLSDDRAARVLVEETIGTFEDKTNAIHYISFLLSESTIPAPLYDLSDHNSTPLRTHGNNMYDVRIYNSIYELTARDSRQGTIKVPKASIAVESMRLHGCSSVKDLAIHFVSQGTPFLYPGETDNSNPFGRLSGPSEGLGYRPMNFKPGWIDYQAYILHRNELLSDPAVVRAALMKGGIIWRLTVDAIAETTGSVSFGRYFEDDVEVIELTSYDIGVIVGLYLIWNGVYHIHFVPVGNRSNIYYS